MMVVCKTGSLSLRNRPFQRVKLPVLHDETACLVERRSGRVHKGVLKFALCLPLGVVLLIADWRWNNPL